jgi:hypothetical protein
VPPEPIDNNYIHINTQGVSVNEQTAQLDVRIHQPLGIDLNNAAATFTCSTTALQVTTPTQPIPTVSPWAGTAIAETAGGAALAVRPARAPTGDAIYGGTTPWWANAAMTIRPPKAQAAVGHPTGATTADERSWIARPATAFPNGNAITVKLNGCTVGAPAVHHRQR